MRISDRTMGLVHTAVDVKMDDDRNAPVSGHIRVMARRKEPVADLSGPVNTMALVTWPPLDA